MAPPFSFIYGPSDHTKYLLSYLLCTVFGDQYLHSAIFIRSNQVIPLFAEASSMLHDRSCRTWGGSRLNRRPRDRTRIDHRSHRPHTRRCSPPAQPGPRVLPAGADAVGGLRAHRRRGGDGPVIPYVPGLSRPRRRPGPAAARPARAVAAATTRLTTTTGKPKNRPSRSPSRSAAPSLHASDK